MATRSARGRTARARSAGRQAASSRIMSALARAGLGARGVIYALTGIIAIQIALGISHRQADNSGALRLVAATPLGSVLLSLLGVGFAGLTLWRVSAAGWGADGRGGRKASQRLGALFQAWCFRL